MAAPIVTKFLRGEIGQSKDFPPENLIVKGPSELGAILAGKGANPDWNNRHVSTDKNPTLVSALEKPDLIAEALALGDRVGLGTEVRTGLASYGIRESLATSLADTDSFTNTSSDNYMPSDLDVRSAYQRRCRPGEEVDPETWLNWIESDLTAEGRSLSPDWREVVKKRLEQMYPKLRIDGDRKNMYDFFWMEGFQFSSEILTRYTLHLSKPFVILTGISGTGKTKIAQIFAEYMTQGTTAQRTNRYGQARSPSCLSDRTGWTIADCWVFSIR